MTEFHSGIGRTRNDIYGPTPSAFNVDVDPAISDEEEAKLHAAIAEYEYDNLAVAAIVTYINNGQPPVLPAIYKRASKRSLFGKVLDESGIQLGEKNEKTERLADVLTNIFGTIEIGSATKHDGHNRA